jgi:hypothetical protein
MLGEDAAIADLVYRTLDQEAPSGTLSHDSDVGFAKRRCLLRFHFSLSKLCFLFNCSCDGLPRGFASESVTSESSR